MDVAAPILIGLVTMLPAALVGALALYASREKAKRHEVWTQAATELGLRFSGERMFGVIDGQSVQVRTETRGKNKQAFTIWEAVLSPPFDLGLSVREQGMFSGVAALFGQQDVPTGDRSFDEQFLAQGDEPARVRAVLTPETRSLLAKISNAGYDVSVSDAGVHVETGGAEDHAGRLKAILQNTAALARALERARGQVPVAAALAPHREKWAQYAEHLGLRGLDCPLCMWGELEGLHVQAYAARADDGAYQLSVLVKFPKPLGLGLSLRPRTTFDHFSSLFGGQDIATGDARFDRVFTLKASTEQLASRLFDDRVRERLLELHDKHPVHLFDNGVHVTAQSLADPAQVPRLIAEAKGILEDIYELARRGGASHRSAAYR
jgi:hypothetical protein